MKKLIVAASALMLTGTMVSTAAAEITFTGDAFARYYFEDNINLAAGNNMQNNDADSWRSRVRLNVVGTTASGAKAYTRLRMDNNRWGDAARGLGGSGDGVVRVDYAYIEVPFGCTTLTAGDWDFGSGLDGWHNDTDVEAVALTWANDSTTVTGIYAIFNSERLAGQAAPANWGVAQDENRMWGLVISHNFENDWNVTFATSLDDYDIGGLGLANAAGNNDHLAWSGQLGVSGQLGPVALAAEIGFQGDGAVSTDETTVNPTGDTGFGAFISAGMDFDAVGVTFIAGMTDDGYVFDAPVGFIMLAGDSMLSPVTNIGAWGAAPVDTWFLGFKTTYQASEKLGLGFNIAYANMDWAKIGPVDPNTDADAFEISGSLSYALADGVSVTSEIGYLDWDVDVPGVGNDIDENAFAAVVSLNLSF